MSSCYRTNSTWTELSVSIFSIISNRWRQPYVGSNFWINWTCEVLWFHPKYISQVDNWQSALVIVKQRGFGNTFARRKCTLKLFPVSGDNLMLSFLCYPALKMALSLRLRASSLTASCQFDLEQMMPFFTIRESRICYSLLKCSQPLNSLLLACLAVILGIEATETKAINMAGDNPP